jgi:hypothetical protein
VRRQNLPEAHDAGSVCPCDGRAKAVKAIVELAKITENRTDNRMWLGSIPLSDF